LRDVLARAVDSAALVGPTGSAVEPQGIIYTPGVSAITGAAPTYGLMVDLVSAPANLNALAGSLGWSANFAVRQELLKLTFFRSLVPLGQFVRECIWIELVCRHANSPTAAWAIAAFSSAPGQPGACAPFRAFALPPVASAVTESGPRHADDPQVEFRRLFLVIAILQGFASVFPSRAIYPQLRAC
jgi:hypothetical protein